MVGILDALGEEKAVIVGHDWRALVAWRAALLRPDRFRGVAGLSVPFLPRPPLPPTRAMPRTDRSQFYVLYFQEPGVAEAEFERDLRHTIRTLLFFGSGYAPPRPSDGTPDTAPGMVPRDGGFLSRPAAPRPLPAWLTEADVDFYANEFARTGFRSGLNWYRNIDRDWELMAPFAGLKVVSTSRRSGRRCGLDGTRADRQPAEVRPEPAQDDHAAGLRAYSRSALPRSTPRCSSSCAACSACVDPKSSKRPLRSILTDRENEAASEFEMDPVFRIKSPSLQPKTASSCLPPVPGANLERALRVDLTRSPERSLNDRYCLSRLPTASPLHSSNPGGSPGKHALRFDL
jgi:hypothetical protein